MTAPPVGISRSRLAVVACLSKAFILAQQLEIRPQREELLVLPQEKEQMRQKLTAMAAELASQASQALGRRCGHPLSGVDPAPHRHQVIVAICVRLAACLREPMAEALREARVQPLVYMDETGAPAGNADGSNAEGRRDWLWVLMTPRWSCWVPPLAA